MKIGTKVTWGTGNIRGEVTVAPTKAFNHETRKEELFARVALTQPYKAPCGATFPKGTVITVPVRELRELS